MFLFIRNRENRKYSLGRIDYDNDGDLCLKADRCGEKIKIEHGDVIRIRASGNGHAIRNYVFIDDSD